jgi:hypothetical protein
MGVLIDELLVIEIGLTDKKHTLIADSVKCFHEHTKEFTVLKDILYILSVFKSLENKIYPHISRICARFYFD